MMPNDIKPKVAPRGGKPGMNPMFAGIIIGLLLGIFLALGVAIWLNRPNQHAFVEKTKPVEALPPIKQPTTSTQPAKDGKVEPRFEFYQILPGEKEAKSGSSSAASSNASASVPSSTTPAPFAATKETPKDTKAAEAAKSSAVPATPVKSADETLFLQAGAFQNIADAENLKAKIAFAGFEANVKSVNLPEKGTLYRVRLGPYKSQDEVNRIKGVLSQNGIAAAVVRPE
jgi:cell division protein FtsN